MATVSRRSEAPVLVTGALGVIGSYVVRMLAERGDRVVALVRAGPEDPRLEGLPGSVEVCRGDLTDHAVVEAAVRSFRPRAVVHLAAVIPPHCYGVPEATRHTNVGATQTLVSAVQRHAPDARFVLASSCGVYGSRNPHTMPIATAEEELRPRDIYGATKAQAERIVRDSGLDWLVLRVGAVIGPEVAMGRGADAFYLSAVLPADARVQTVDVRDTARAFVAAVDVGASREVLLVAGDESHRHRHHEVVAGIAAAVGLIGGTPRLAPGDPADDEAWFIGDWMDTARAQQVLDFQRTSWADSLTHIRARAGARRFVLPLFAPLVRLGLAVAYRRIGFRTPHAQPWEGISARWGTDVVR